MVTNRARWLIFFGVIGTLGGLMRGKELLTLISLSTLVWLFLEWTLFRWRVEIQCRAISCERLVNGLRNEQGTLWTKRPIEVTVRIQSSKLIRIPFVRLEDFLPENMAVTEGENTIDVTLSGRNSTEHHYTAIARGPGTVVMQGVCARIFDLHGLFSAQRFFPCRQVFRVLPTCIELDVARPSVKRSNVVPPPGIHRLKNPGMGAELLELREYMPGDPPKSIAWKVSARRGTLMTRQYESEVPVRTTLFVDTSYGTQIGAFGERPLDKLSAAAGTIAKSMMNNRDPVGLVTFEESKTRTFQSGLGDRHFYRLLDILTDCATTQDVSELTRRRLHDPPKAPPVRLSDRLMSYAWDVGNDLYPDRLTSNISRVPFTIFPILPGSRQRFHRRLRLSGLFTELYQLAGDAPVRLTYDDRMMAKYCQQFLMDAGYAWVQPVVPRRGREIHDWHSKFDSITEALTRSIARGRDNELFVLLVDLIDYVGPLGKLAHAIKVARARHHRVVVICAWSDPEPPRFDVDPLSRRIDPFDVEGLLRRAEKSRLNAAAESLRQQFRGIGVPIGFAGSQETLNIVLNQAELARTGRTTRSV